MRIPKLYPGTATPTLIGTSPSVSKERTTYHVGRRYARGLVISP
jgi:hypothetical protein